MDKSKLDAEIKLLSKKREVLVERVDRLKDYALELDSVKPPAKILKAFNIMYPKFEDTISEIKKYDLRINELYLQDDPEFDPVFTPYEDNYDFIHYIAKTLQVSEPQGVQSTGPLASETIVDSKILLNKLEIPEFSGTMETWLHFSQLFDSLVHCNKHFSELQKVSYLVSKLKGPALKSVQLIPPTAENYSVIRELLWGRYDNPRVVADSYFNQVFNFVPFKTESRETLESFLNNFSAPIAALKRLYSGSDLSDQIFLYRGLRVIDPRSRREFENFSRNKRDVSFDDLSAFIEGQLRTLNNQADKSNDNKLLGKGDFKKPQNSHVFMVDSVKPEKVFVCMFCKMKGHTFVNCRKIEKMSPWDRFRTAKRLNLCLKCFSYNHAAADCKTNNCKECGNPHNVLLHYAKKVEASTPSSSVTANCAVAQTKTSVVLLSTAQVEVKDRQGRTHTARFLLDSGSESHFITSKLSKKLALPFERVRSSVIGLGGKSSSVLGKTHLTFTSKFDSKTSFSIEPLIIDKIIDKLPSAEIDVSELSYLKSLMLADEVFSHPSVIDGIIGAELIPHILSGTKVVDVADNPVAIYSALGFVLMGKAPLLKKEHSDSVSFCSFLSDECLPNILEKFWNLEEVPHKTHLTFEEKECEKLYTSTVRRNDDGRFVVSLPFRIESPNLGDTFHTAERRFFNLEKKLDKNEDMKISYHKALKDYIDQGHISLMEGSNHQDGYFIPHHCVYKESTSTPMRVVFDASAKGSSGLSLNDALYTGPKLQADIFSLLLNFRIFKIALSADIKQMYRQIEVRDTDRMYQKILWRFSKNQSLQTYCHNMVVFGLSSSPYLALRTVIQLVAEEGKNFPVASRYVPRDMYMDDLVTSVENFEEASELHHQAKALFQKGGFHLVKWTSNFPDQIRDFSDRLEQNVEKNFIKEDHTLPILGLVWDPSDDNFHFKINLKPSKGTKREILSVVARIYDPLGFLAPVLLLAKGLIKELWKEKKDWDDLPSASISEIWEKFQAELAIIPDLKFPRHLGIQTNAVVSLFGFCDASERGYGAVIYLLVETPENSLVRFLCAKSKIAPSKTLSIPRLELCAALLLSRLIQSAYSILKLRIPIKQVLAFSDSEIVLCWLRSSPACWQTFVANRVAEIQDRSEIGRWSHVSGKQNPADCLSRGLLPGELPLKSLWWNGPPWILWDPAGWPITSSIPDCDPPERKNTTVMVVAIDNTSNQIEKLIENSSDYGRLLRTLVIVLRFLKLIPKIAGTRHDLDHAEHYLCKVVQNFHFAEDISNLQNNRLSSKGIRCLNPFLKDGIIRVGGRLSRAKLGYDHAHPVLLPKKHRLVNLIIDYYHRVNLHTGPHLLLAVLRQKFWILSARSVVRQRIKSCNLCFINNPRPTYPIMADLPECRVNESKAFLHTGVDYAGPIKISIGRKRNPVTSKAYICLFVCLTTKAVHLELVSGLSSELFLSAFKRFLSRRGECRVMYSDNGTNFIGAKTELDELYRFISESKHQNLLNKGLEVHRIDWKFLPPNSPHFGGIWEANIKSVKTHLFKVIGLQVLSYEELNSILIQIESLLNSRPLCPLSADPSDPVVLTPAHFLMASPLTSLPSSDLTQVSQNRLSRFQLVDQMVQTFWNRWKREYLHELQVRRKWLTDNSSVTKGTVVVVEQNNSPPLSWPLGVVEEIYPGVDGVVRVVQVRTTEGSYKRPVIKVYPLPTQ